MNRKISSAALLFLQALSSACVHIESDLVRRHVISIDTEGRPLDPATQDELDVPFREYVRSILEHVDRYNDGAPVAEEDTDACTCVGHAHPPGKERKIRRLLIHIHGGLNTASTSMAAAQDTILAMRDETDPGDRYFPIFVTWPSGPLSSYGEHLFLLRQGRHAPAWGIPTSPVYFARDTLGGVLNSTRSWLYQAATDSALAAKVAFDWNLLPSWDSADTLYGHIDKSVPRPYNVRCGSYRRGADTQAARLLLYWSMLPFKLLTSAIVLDGMGLGSWQVMLHRTENVLRRSREFELRSGAAEEAERLDAALTREASGAFAVFLDELAKHIEKEEDEQDDGTLCYQITLVGHSMGAIIINSLLRLFPDLPVTRVVYMAPACSIGEAEQAVIPFLKRHPDAKFHLLTLHPLAESDEINFGDAVPRGSLLEWIDNFYTTPTSHVQRRLGKWINVMQALHIFKDVKKQIEIKAFGVDGSSLPQKHGHFNLCPFWKREFWDPGGPMLYYVEGDGRPEPR